MENKLRKPYATLEGIPVHFTFYRANANRKSKTIIYLHGGGFVYGTSDDLPETYLQQILAAGYDFVTLAYPLAPEVTLDVITSKVKEGVEWFQQHYADELGLDSSEYVLFGRSAGAYLAAFTAHQVEQKPAALLLFYGYHTLQEASFHVPSRHYLAYPKVDERVIKKLTTGAPQTEGPKQTRFSIYIFYRQTGNWIKALLKPDKKPAEYSLSNNDLNQLPPAFLAASTRDPDVPYRITKKMANLIPKAKLEAIDSDEHDFDRTTTDTIGKEIYEEMLLWLESLQPD